MPAEAAEPLDEARLESAAGLLTRAFAADPGLLFVLPELEDRMRLNFVLARAAVRYTIRCGAPLVTTDEMRGVALWFPPDPPEPTSADFAKSGVAAVPSRIGRAAGRRFGRMLAHVNELHAVHAPDPHWYLAMLGVEPSAQRQGIGEALMRPVFEAADREGLCCYLEAPTDGKCAPLRAPRLSRRRRDRRPR